MFPQVNRALIREMPVVSSRVMTERDSVRNAGASIQSIAHRQAIKVTTKKCFVVIPTEDRMITAVFVTRVR
jgi:hypothetical protein